MKSKLITVLSICTSFLISCSTEPSTGSETETTPPINNPSEPPIIKPFEPDAFWTNPTEVTSQYGPSGIIRDVVIDQNGIIWMAAWDGIMSYNPETKQFMNHTLKGLSHHRVYSVMEDSKGNMWFGTMGAGAYKYDGTKFTNLSSNNGMINNVVMDLFEDSKGNIWFATNKGVSMYNGTICTNLDSSKGLNGAVYAISEDQTGTMWFGSEDGLFYFTKDDSVLTELLTDQETHYSNVRDIHNNNGTMYFGTSLGFYTIRQTEGDSVEVIRLTKDFTSYIHTDRSHNLLLTAGGIFRYDVMTLSTADDAYDRMTTVIGNKNNLGIFGATESHDGTIWYGAMDGLHSVKDGKDLSYRKP